MEAWALELAEALSRAKYCDRKAIIERYEAMTGKSRQQLYKIAADAGFCSGRKKRSDAGKSVATSEQVLSVVGILKETSREVKGQIMPVAEALTIAEERGIIEKGALSVSRMTALLREYKLSRKDREAPKPHTDMRSLHPNHVHLVDVSVCIQYYLRNGKMLIDTEDGKYYKNKFENFAKEKQKIYRYVLVDHTSHCIFFKYYIAEGETQANLYDFLCSAWEAKTNPKFPFRGVPWILLMDRGAANISKAVQAWIKGLDVEFPEPGGNNPKRQGSVEKAHNFIEGRFEAKLRMQPACSVETLNEWALDFMGKLNGSLIHSRHKMARTECWLKISKEQLRELPDRKSLQELFAEPEVERLVTGSYLVEFKTRRFSVKHIDGIIPNRSKVAVVYRPLSWPEVSIRFEDKEYRAVAIDADEYGFRADGAVIGKEFKAQPETIVQKKEKIVEGMAYGAYGDKRPKNATPFPGPSVFGNDSATVKTDYLPRVGTPIIIDKSNVEDREEPIMQLFVRLKGLGQISKNLNAGLRARYGNTIKSSELERVLEAYEAGLLTPDGEIMGGVDDSAKAANQ